MAQHAAECSTSDQHHLAMFVNLPSSSSLAMLKALHPAAHTLSSFCRVPNKITEEATSGARAAAHSCTFVYMCMRRTLDPCDRLQHRSSGRCHQLIQMSSPLSILSAPIGGIQPSVIFSLNADQTSVQKFLHSTAFASNIVHFSVPFADLGVYFRIDTGKKKVRIRTIFWQGHNGQTTTQIPSIEPSQWEP